MGNPWFAQPRGRKTNLFAKSRLPEVKLKDCPKLLGAMFSSFLLPGTCWATGWYRRRGSLDVVQVKKKVYFLVS